MARPTRAPSAARAKLALGIIISVQEPALLQRPMNSPLRGLVNESEFHFLRRNGSAVLPFRSGTNRQCCLHNAEAALARSAHHFARCRGCHPREPPPQRRSAIIARVLIEHGVS